MLRILFTSEDVARTRIAPAADPLWELVLAIHMFRGQNGDLLFGGWRRSTGEAIRRAGPSAKLQLLSALTPTFGYFPDFLNPAAAIDGLAHGLEAIRATPVPVLARDLRRLSVPASVERSVKALAQGDVGVLTALTESMRVFYEAAVAPCRPLLESAVERDRAVRVAAMTYGGVEGLLDSLRPTAFWSAGELRVPGHPDQELELGGRGLLLVPSYFCIKHPMTLFDGSLPPVLIYPVVRTLETVPGTNRGLGALMGRTRAAALEAIGTGCSTAELAGRVGVSVASASEHATVLRDAGLVTSQRDQSRMVHRVTQLGLALLNGG